MDNYILDLETTWAALEKKRDGCPVDAYPYPSVGLGELVQHDVYCRTVIVDERGVLRECTRKGRHSGAHHAHDAWNKCSHVWERMKNEKKNRIGYAGQPSEPRT